MARRTPTTPFVPSPMNRFGGWLRSWMLRMATQAEWEALGQRERCRIANDLGVGDCEMSNLLHSGRGTTELDQLLRRAGLRDIAARSGALHDLQRVCTLCADKDDCREWLTVQARPHQHAALPGFCPNRGELNVLRQQQSRATPV